MKNKIHKLALFGDPVCHSLSPQIHQMFANQFDLEVDYQLIQVNQEKLSASVKQFFQQGGIGANVTLPHKQNIITDVCCLSEAAKTANAVNTLSIKQNLLCGDNTDGMGFIHDICKRHGFDFNQKSVLILGAGGASQGIVPAIIQQTPNLLVVANRTLKKAQDLCVYENSQAMNLTDLMLSKEKFDLIIHASSLGHQGKTLTFEKNHSHKDTIAYDLSYGKPALAFIEFCQLMKINKIYDGLGMLVEQAACSFKIWMGLNPLTDQVYGNIKNNDNK